MILVRQRRPKQRHDAVAQDLVHRALVAMHGRHQAFEHQVKDVPRFLGDMNPHEPLHHWLQIIVVHHLPLQRVEDLLADQGGHPQRGADEGERERVDDHSVISARLHRLGADGLDHLAEHHHVAGLVAEFRQLVVRGAGRRILMHHLAQQRLVEDVLEPDARRKRVDELLP